MSRLIISKLFGMYDYDIDLSKKCIVLIGENGLGKSTILRIIQCLVDGNFVELSKYRFDKLTIENNKKIISLKYCDLFPIVDFFCINDSPRHEVLNPFGQTNEESDLVVPGMSVLGKVFKMVFEDYGINEYCSLLSTIYFNRNIEDEFLMLLLNLFRADYLYLCENNWEDEVRKMLSALVNDNYFETSQTYIDRYLFNRKNLQRFLGVSECFYADLVEKMTIDKDGKKDERCADFIYENSELNSFYHKIFGNVINPDSDDLNFQRNQQNSKYIGGVETDDLINELKEIYSRNNIVDYNFHPKTKDIRIENKMQINTILTEYYYEDEYIRDMNKKMITYYFDMLGTQKNELTDIQAKTVLEFYNAHIHDILDNICPLIVKNSIFHKDYVNYINGKESCNQTDLAFMRFFEDEYINILSYKSHRIFKYQKLLSKFLFNKKIDIYNGGLRIFNRDRKQVNLNLLSSGERKIIIVLFMAIFINHLTLIIDEPELSLSIIWQNWLLKAILNSTRNRKVIIATHSPYLLEDPDVHEYIQPLYADFTGADDE